MVLNQTFSWKKPVEIVFDLHSGQRAFHASTSALTIFKQSQSGPTPLPGGDMKLPFAAKQAEVLIKLGMFYELAVGQGTCYSTGLFGPLPALGSDFHCLIYATTALDSEQMDPRMKGWSYLVACFFYHSELEPRIMERRALLEQLFSDFFGSRQHVEEIANDTSKLKKHLRQYILE
ncbi:MAG: hypothetical protein ACFFD4_27175 [Candidatus Odinarchaeota archaeon]